MKLDFQIAESKRKSSVAKGINSYAQLGILGKEARANSIFKNISNMNQMQNQQVKKQYKLQVTLNKTQLMLAQKKSSLIDLILPQLSNLNAESRKSNQEKTANVLKTFQFGKEFNQVNNLLNQITNSNETENRVTLPQLNESQPKQSFMENEINLTADISENDQNKNLINQSNLQSELNSKKLDIAQSIQKEKQQVKMVVYSDNIQKDNNQKENQIDSMQVLDYLEEKKVQKAQQDLKLSTLQIISQDSTILKEVSIIQSQEVVPQNPQNTLERAQNLDQDQIQINQSIIQEQKVQNFQDSQQNGNQNILNANHQIDQDINECKEQETIQQLCENINLEVNAIKEFNESEIQ